MPRLMPEQCVATSARICLVMIVKNEQTIIERCLEAALPHIDTWSITDTGSTDNTTKIVEQFFADRKITGKISRAPFKDFAQARNAALDAAKTVDGWDYALLVDADMVLTGTIDKTKLTGPAYDLVQIKSGDSYDNTRLVHRDAVARYIGVTHEFLSVSGTVRVTSLTIDDRDDGGSKSDKSDRDIRLLNAGLVEEPDNGRYMFYLAQTYREIGRHHEAIQWYERRIKSGGWDEEIWYSYYGIARSYLALNDEAPFIKACFDAYNYRPTRGEPLKMLARFFRERSINDAAMIIAEGLAKIEYPEDDKLFIERNVYDFGAEQEFAIAGFYSRLSNRREKAYETCVGLTVCFNEFIRNEARRNITFYLKSANQMFGAEVKPIEWKPNDGYAPMNPSVCVADDGRRLVLVRTVNYTVTAQGQYPTTDGSNIIRTRNHVVEMDSDWKPIRSTLIEDVTGTPRNSFPVEGFEDCRLWADGEKFYASATVRDLGDGRCEQAILSIDDRWRVIDIDVVRDYEHGRDQKNWMPIVGHHMNFLYFCDPTIVIKVTSGATIERSRSLPLVSLVDQRGSSQVIEHEDGWLCVTHEVTWRPERIYMHRFIKLDREMRVVAITDPFYFANVGIEFCAGLARDGEKIIASFGINDASAHLAMFDSKRVDQALKLLRDES
jgi:glycosyltransferase involved in cell wall biosynthesis